MNLKKLQNLPNTPVGKIFNTITWFKGYSPFLPRYIQLLLTYKCNLNCSFCYQPKEKKENFPDMNMEDVRIIEENIRKSYKLKPKIHLFGGEPTINKDFVKILRFFSEKNYKVSFTTNGWDINKYIEDIVETKNLVEINMSLNTTNFEKYLSTLKLFEKYERKIYVTLNCPITNKNQSTLIPIIKKFENSYASSITIEYTIFTANYKIKVDPNNIRDQVEEIKKTKYKIPVLFLPDLKLDDIGNFFNNLQFPNKSRCIYPWFLFFIQPNGDIVPCEEIDIMMGNAKKESLKDIWNNERYRNFRQNIRKHGLKYPICVRCCHRQYY